MINLVICPPYIKFVGKALNNAVQGFIKFKKIILKLYEEDLCAYDGT